MLIKRYHSTAIVKVYHGYGHKDNLILFGHVLRRRPVVRKKYSKNIFTNIIHLVRLFFVKPVPGAKVMLQWDDQKLYGVSEADGFFKFEWQSLNYVAAGWHDVKVQLLNEDNHVAGTGVGKIFVPHSTQYGFISDIDDTVLVSHAATTFKRLRTLFTKNPVTRKSFEKVVSLYQQLSVAHTTSDVLNPFFYVSSSEWNLYDDLNDFFKHNDLPKGAFLLSEIKQWYQLLKSGKTKHGGKLLRIVRIIEAFPAQQFILLGDNTQSDPDIYTALANKYPHRIVAIFIRNIVIKNEVKTRLKFDVIENKTIPICIFDHTADAIEFSKKTGLIL